jgi:hypothetical protein
MMLLFRFHNMIIMSCILAVLASERKLLISHGTSISMLIMNIYRIPSYLPEETNEPLSISEFHKSDQSTYVILRHRLNWAYIEQHSVLRL